MVVPTPGGERNELVLAAAAICRGGPGVHASAARRPWRRLAYGTQTVPQVDKIVGPGNAYVAAAKRRVFGAVGIDMIAGPSEILVICDGRTNPDWIAMDLFSQAEHDELAQAILLCPDAQFVDAVADSIERQLPEMPRREVIEASLRGRGALIQVRDLDEACEIANRIAPEHLELSVEDPQRWVAEDPPCRRDLPRPLHLRGAGRLLRGSEPRVAHLRHRALLVAARRLRLPEAHQPDPGLRRGRAQARRDRSRAGHGEGLPAHARSAQYRLHG